MGPDRGHVMTSSNGPADDGTVAAVLRLADLVAPCWRRHPLCLAYLDALHEAWCLLYLGPRDPKMVLAQLDWLTRSLLQAAEVLANETRRCRDLGQHHDPGEQPGQQTPWLRARR